MTHPVLRPFAFAAILAGAVALGCASGVALLKAGKLIFEIGRLRW